MKGSRGNVRERGWGEKGIVKHLPSDFIVYHMPLKIRLVDLHQNNKNVRLEAYRLDKAIR